MNEKQTAIKELQQSLRDIAKVDSDIISVIPDGIFGEETEDSVKSFQRKHGFTDTGVVDFALWSKIAEERKKALFELSEPVQVIKISREDLPLVLGQESAQIHMLNMMLNELSARHDNFSNVGHGNVFTNETEAQVKNWQAVIAHDITGEVDKQTWNTLALYYLI